MQSYACTIDLDDVGSPSADCSGAKNGSRRTIGIHKKLIFIQFGVIQPVFSL